MWVVKGWEEISDSELQRRVDLVNILSLQEGYSPDIDRQFLGICTECGIDKANHNSRCKHCLSDLRGDLI